MPSQYLPAIIAPGDKTSSQGKGPSRSGQSATAATARESLSNWDWQRILPETLLLIVVLVAIDFIFFKGDAFISVVPSPYWIPVLLMSAQYGISGGLFATLMASLTIYIISPQQQLANQDYYSHASLLALRPVGWLACALTIGGLRSLHILRTAELSEELNDAREIADGLGKSLQRSLQEIGFLERRIAGDCSTLDAVMAALAKLDVRNRFALTASFARLAQEATGAASLTLYFSGSDGLAPAARIVTTGGAGLAEAPVLQDELVSMLRTSGRAIDRSSQRAGHLLPPGAMLAAPINLDHHGTLVGVLLVETLWPGQDAGNPTLRAEQLGNALGKLLVQIPDAAGAGHEPRSS